MSVRGVVDVLEFRVFEEFIGLAERLDFEFFADENSALGLDKGGFAGGEEVANVHDEHRGEVSLKLGGGY